MYNILIEKKKWWGTLYDGNHININKKTTGEKGLGSKKKQYFLNTQQQEKYRLDILHKPKN